MGQASCLPGGGERKAARQTQRIPRRKIAGQTSHPPNGFLLLLGWTAQLGNHKVLIGVPSYEDAPGTSDPQVENITNATLGVRSAPEDLGGGSDSFQGIAIYANWVTDASEWQELRNTWFPGSLAQRSPTCLRRMPILQSPTRILPARPDRR